MAKRGGHKSNKTKTQQAADFAERGQAAWREFSEVSEASSSSSPSTPLETVATRLERRLEGSSSSSSNGDRGDPDAARDGSPMSIGTPPESENPYLWFSHIKWRLASLSILMDRLDRDGTANWFRAYDTPKFIFAFDELEQFLRAIPSHSKDIQQLQLQASALQAAVTESQSAASAAERRDQELRATVAALQAQVEEQRAKLDAVTRSIARVEDAEAVDGGKVLLREVSGSMLPSIQRAGNLEAVASASGAPVSGRYVRAWQSAGRDVWNVVVEVTPQERVALIGAARKVRSTGVVVAPYLTSAGIAQRRERLKSFEELRAAGLKPRWKGGAGIQCQGT